MRYTTITTLTGLLLAMSSASAFARPAIATFNANMRSGPGVENPVVAIIPDQADIDVGSCAGSWCRVSWNGFEGYLSTSLIAFASQRAPRAIASEPSDNFEVSVAPGYGYDGGYGSDYAYDDSGYGYDNPGVYGGGIYAGGIYAGGYNGGGYYGRRLGGGRLGAGYGPGNVQGAGRGPGTPVVRTGASGGPGRGFSGAPARAAGRPHRF